MFFTLNKLKEIEINVILKNIYLVKTKWNT